MLREKARAKYQFCEDAFIHNELLKKFDIGCNTTTTQTETENVTTINIKTQTKPKMIEVFIESKIEDACLNVEKLPDVETVTETEGSDYEQSSEELESEFENKE